MFGHWLHLVTFLRGETQPLSAARIYQIAYITEFILAPACLPAETSKEKEKSRETLLPRRNDLGGRGYINCGEA